MYILFGIVRSTWYVEIEKLRTEGVCTSTTTRYIMIHTQLQTARDSYDSKCYDVIVTIRFIYACCYFYGSYIYISM